MAQQAIQFDDGGAYEQYMGAWSRLAGEVFLDWLAPAPGLRWVDIGCGNGAFTELLIQRCSPSEVQGIDPSEAQIDFARKRPAARLAEFRCGDAMALPFPEHRFDAAVMALVIFFVPDPRKGVAEMARVVRPGGPVAAYAWDILEGGLPYSPVQAEMRAAGMTPTLPPSVEASRMPALRALWSGAGLEAIETREIVVERSFTGFDDYWAMAMLATTLRRQLEAMAPADLARLKEGVRARLKADAAGRVFLCARANAIKARVPA